jgi:hypothetical protein
MRDGDVLIARDERHPSRYTLTQVPGMPQVTWPSRHDAELAARQFARRHAVDVWIDEEGTLARLAAHRPAPPAPPGPRPAGPAPSRPSTEDAAARRPPPRPTSPSADTPSSGH